MVEPNGSQDLVVSTKIEADGPGECRCCFSPIGGSATKAPLPHTSGPTRVRNHALVRCALCAPGDSPTPTPPHLLTQAGRTTVCRRRHRKNDARAAMITAIHTGKLTSDINPQETRYVYWHSGGGGKPRASQSPVSNVPGGGRPRPASCVEFSTLHVFPR